MVAVASIQGNGYRVTSQSATFNVIARPAGDSEFTLHVNSLKQNETYLEQNMLHVDELPSDSGVLVIGTSTPATITLTTGMDFDDLVGAFEDGLDVVSYTVDGKVWTLSSDSSLGTVTLSTSVPVLNYVPAQLNVPAIGGSFNSGRLAITGIRSLRDGIIYSDDAIQLNHKAVISVTPKDGEVTGYTTMPDADLQGTPTWTAMTAITAVDAYAEEVVEYPYGYVKVTLDDATESLCTVMIY